ncbi:MAG: hypothetical protein FWE53_02870 [Firmicutes bacterium]|nr:hypothetical protein [Bacillota bacterium]
MSIISLLLSSTVPIFGLEVDLTTIIVVIGGGFVTWYFGMLLRNKETRNKARESFIKDKITVYGRIRVFIADFFDRDFAPAPAHCSIKTKTSYFDTQISFSKILADRAELQKRSGEIHEIITDGYFFLDPKLVKLLRALREALFKIHLVHKENDDYNTNFNDDNLFAFLVTEDVLWLCAQINKQLFKFYNKPKFFKFGKYITPEQERKMIQNEREYWKSGRSSIAFLCDHKRPVYKWTNAEYRRLFKQNNQELLYLSLCRDCNKSCWREKKGECAIKSESSKAIMGHFNNYKL